MTDGRPDPVIARFQCGELARQLRVAAKLEHGEAEGLLRALTPSFYATKLTKVENGAMPPSTADVEAMIALYLPTVDQADELRALARDARRRAQPGAIPGPRSRQYLSLERLAVEIRMVYNEIPGLLQTREYARAALSASPVVAASAVDRLAEERAERSRRIIRPDGARVWITLGEEVLDRANGGPAILRRQLEHLREVAAMPNVRLRVVTRAAGAVAGLSAPFTLLHTADGKSFAFVATVVRGDYVKATEPFAAIFQNAWERATPEEESAAILDARIADLTDS
ncbi:DUF5753 domain-containing protein [Saccharothrix algeriensis]|uniref:DUF5753 domain-containing protein n=1 Tax=Saccharothrix algeriensis TaxID=173560 RepID=A0A8T8HVJ3_9PSEU|nr:DUF5753 domain-containing protein [Saccharothrix algeriensis]MBM7814112.1 hypothetical protein [Saccharothrix algeriensis]QTR02492.1 hypothetical protein J7S33_25770 [Saccharothrix algeriensis]